MRVAIEEWLAPGDTGELADLIGDALDLLGRRLRHDPAAST